MDLCSFCDSYHAFDHACFEKLKAEFRTISDDSLSQREQDILDLEERIARIENHMRIRELYVQSWCAKATSGEYKLHQIQVGQENENPDKRWRDLSDEEKLAGVFRTINQHITFVDKLGEDLINLKRALNILKMSSTKVSNDSNAPKRNSDLCVCGADKKWCSTNQKVNGVHLNSHGD